MNDVQAPLILRSSRTGEGMVDDSNGRLRRVARWLSGGPLSPFRDAELGPRLSDQIEKGDSPLIERVS